MKLVMKPLLATLLSLLLATSAFAAETATSQALPKPLTFDEVFQKGDRVLFVGDELTQQMMYTRGVAAAVMAIRPGFDLRFFNGGHEGATSATANEWIEDLLGLTKPTVVFICFGANDLKPGGDAQAAARSFEENFRRLVQRIKKEPAVREVILLSPPPVERDRDSTERWSDENLARAELAKAVFRVAAEEGCGYIELLSHMRQVYVDARKTEGAELTRAGVPSEEAHVVIASLVLRGVGVTSTMLDSIGWSPLTPLRMRRVRQALAIPSKAPSLEAAEKSRKLYESMGDFDERFFRLWRLAPKHPSLPPREELRPAVDEAWSKVTDAERAYE